MAAEKKRSLLLVALVAGTQQNLSSQYYLDVYENNQGYNNSSAMLEKFCYVNGNPCYVCVYRWKVCAFGVCVCDMCVIVLKVCVCVSDMCVIVLKCVCVCDCVW